jgi:hypothetical protein
MNYFDYIQTKWCDGEPTYLVYTTDTIKVGETKSLSEAKKMVNRHLKKKDEE